MISLFDIRVLANELQVSFPDSSLPLAPGRCRERRTQENAI